MVQLTPDDAKWGKHRCAFAEKQPDKYAGWFTLSDVCGDPLDEMHRDEIRALAEFAGFVVTENKNES